MENNTETYSVCFTGNPAGSDFARSGSTGGGCAGFMSVLRFDNKLFYYDHFARNVFAYYLYDSGQTRPTDGLANDIKKYFDIIPNGVSRKLEGNCKYKM